MNASGPDTLQADVKRLTLALVDVVEAAGCTDEVFTYAALDLLAVAICTSTRDPGDAAGLAATVCGDLSARVPRLWSEINDARKGRQA